MYTERELIEKLRRRFHQSDVPMGIGDDAAVIDWPSGLSPLFCSDLLAENTHFRRETHPPDSLGFKAIAINVSDVGAMGGQPRYCVLSLALPSDIEDTWIDRFIEGIGEGCHRFDTRLVGGDTSRAAQIFIDVSMIGSVDAGRAIGRNGARPGDSIYVTGTLGSARKGLELLGTVGPEHPSVRRHLYPEPRHRVGRALAGRATAMIDVSDGLSTDLGHILEASRVSAEIVPSSIPKDDGVALEYALHGGEDYELIVTSAERIPDSIDGVALTRIGTIIPSENLHQTWLVRESGRETLDAAGWQHF
jgi:thiamine-monophosphate kinase